MKKSVFLFLLPFLFLSGCWDKRELNGLAIATAMGIDKTEEGYLISAQVVVPSELSIKGGPGHSQIVLYQAEGDTVNETFRELSKNTSRIIYPGHLQMLVIGESMAKEGLDKPLDFIARNWEFRTDFYVVIAKESTAEKVLNVQTPLENVPGTMMYYTLENSDKTNSNMVKVTFRDYLKLLDQEGKQPILTGIFIQGDEKNGADKSNLDYITPSTQIKYDGLGVLYKDTLIGWLNGKDIRSFNMVTNRLKKAVFPISCPNNGKATFEADRFSSKMTGNVKSGKPEVDINIHIKGDIGAVECDIDLTNEATILKLEKIFEKELKEAIEQSIKKVQKEFKSDIYGFGSTIYRDEQKEWENMKDHWDERLDEVKVNVNINAKIRNVGAINVTK